MLVVFSTPCTRPIFSGAYCGEAGVRVLLRGLHDIVTTERAIEVVPDRTEQAPLKAENATTSEMPTMRTA